MAEVRAELCKPVLDKIIVELDPYEAEDCARRLCGEQTGTVNLNARTVGNQIKAALTTGLSHPASARAGLDDE